MNATRFKPAFAAIVSIALSGCGGGGGSGSSGGPAASLPPAPPPSTLSLAIDENNAQSSASVATGLLEGFLQLTELAVQVTKNVIDRGELQFSDSCSNGGLVDYDFTDLNQDQVPSPGDSIRATYSDCQSLSLNSVVRGDFIVSFEAPTRPSTSEETNYAGAIDATNLEIIADPNTTVSVTSSFDFEVTDGLLAESRRAMGNVGLRFSGNGIDRTESISGLDFLKSVSYETARYEISAAGIIDSEFLGGSFQYDPTTRISGFLNTYPEAGRMEFEGANRSRIAVAANFVVGSNLARIEVDREGDGTFVVQPNSPFWAELVEGYLWWYEPGSRNSYQIGSFDSNDFFVIHTTPSNEQIVPVNSALRIQFSRPLDPATIPQVISVRRLFSEPPFSEDLPFDVDLRGAAIILRPTEQLQHGFRYFYPVVSFNVSDEFGNNAFVFGSGFWTDDNLSAVAVTSTTTGLPNDTISLDGTSSLATEGSIVSYSWTQTSGPAGQVVNSDQASASFVVPALAGTALIELQLEITNSTGEFDRDTVELSAFGSIADVGILSFYGEQGDFVSQGREWFLTSANGQFTVTRNFDNGISIQHDTATPSFVRWGLDLAAPGDLDLANGPYDGATRYPFQDSANPGLNISGSGRGCNQSAGRFDVLDIAYDANGDVLTAAIDFEQFCDGSPSKLTGHLRIGSLIPVPPRP